MKGYTDFWAPLLGMDIATKPRGDMKFMDWKKAKEIIDEQIKQNPDVVIYAGLREDWNNTSGIIYANGDFYDGGFFYGCSNWATPILDIDGYEIECYTYDITEEGSGTPNWLKSDNVKKWYEYND